VKVSFYSRILFTLVELILDHKAGQNVHQVRSCSIDLYKAVNFPKVLIQNECCKVQAISIAYLPHTELSAMVHAAHSNSV